MKLWVDHKPRVDFYVRHGLVPRAPTDEQIQRATEENKDAAGVQERLKFYMRHPLDMLPTAKKRRALAQANTDVAERGTKVARDDETLPVAANDSGSLLDRTLRLMFQISPLRFSVQCIWNPCNIVPGTGLNVPAKYVIAHIAHAPHPTALWDVQVIHPDEGALDELERQVELADKDKGLKWRIYRSMAQRAGYYDYLRELIPRVRRFDYPPPPPNFNPQYENLVTFLNYAAQLEPQGDGQHAAAAGR